MKPCVSPNSLGSGFATHPIRRPETAAHLEWPPAKVQAVPNYAAAFPEEIRLAIEDNQAVDLSTLHGGVIFVDSRSIAPDDIGGLVRALIGLGDLEGGLDWRDRLLYLKRAP